MTEQKTNMTFLPKKGNYRGLIVYQKAECIYDITFFFAHHFFVERMTAARLGYRNEQKTRIAELETENRTLKARIAELEQKLRKLIGPMGLIGLIGPIGRMGLMRLMGLISLGLTACSSDGGDDAVAPAPTPVTEVAISFSGSESQEVAVNNGTNRANGAYGANGANRAYGPYRRAAGAPLSESTTTFNVWGYKNMAYSAEVYGGTQTVFPDYQVEWHNGSAATTLTNSSGWEYILPETGQSIKYWDWSAKAYRFFAATGFDKEAAVPATPGAYVAYKTYGANGTYGASGDYKTYEISMLADASPELDGESKIDAEATAAKRKDTPYFSRLWFSTGNQVTYPDKLFGKPVTLEFVKPFTRVRYLFIYSYPREGIKLTGKSFKPSDDSKHIARKGIVTVHYPTEGTDIKEWFTVTPMTGAGSGELTELTEDYDPEDDGKEYTETDEGWYMVIPNNAQGTYTLSVNINGETKTAVVPENYMQWLPGYSYTYVFKITDLGGVEIGWVEYAMTSWKEMEADWTVYNW